MVCSRLILVINLAIVTTFIFMSSTRFPSLSGDSVLSNALEQPTTVPQTVYQPLTLSETQPQATKEPQVQETFRPGSYTKVTSTTATDEEEQLLDQDDTTEAVADEPLTVISDADTPANVGTQEDPLRDSESEKRTEDSDTVVTEETAVDPDTATTTTPPTVSSDTSAEPASNAPRPGQPSQAEIADLISQMKESQAPLPETLSPEQPVEASQSSPTSTAAPEFSTEIEPASVESKGMHGLIYLLVARTSKLTSVLMSSLCR